MAQQLRDKNGLTEEEFLAQYSPKDYPRPSLTADNCVFRRRPDGGWQLLLVRRGGHPFLGSWALPGGFVNPSETADAAASRELEEETGVAGLAQERLGLYSDPHRDPRGWTVSEAYVAVDDNGQTAHAGDDASAATWFDVEVSARDGRVTLSATYGDTTLTSSFVSVAQPISGICRAADVRGEGFAFDHARIVADAYLLLVGARG